MERLMTDRTAAAAERIRSVLPEERIIENEPMSKHTSFRIGGPAAVYAVAEEPAELREVLEICTLAGAEHMLIGNGSNFLVADEGYPGIMIKLAGGFDSIAQDSEDETVLTVGASRLLAGTSAYAAERGLAGLEFASGIPGSIGGAVFMNAGAYGGEMKDITESALVMRADGSETFRLDNTELGFGYRHSAVADNGLVVISARLRLDRDEPAAIAERIRDLQARRNAKQPVNYPSAGSTFKRPVGGYAAALIDEAGLKGYRVGGAAVSEKHAGFVINTGGATAADVLAVMRHVRKTVRERSGITLEPEVRLINCCLDDETEA